MQPVRQASEIRWSASQSQSASGRSSSGGGPAFLEAARTYSTALVPGGSQSGRAWPASLWSCGGVVTVLRRFSFRVRPSR